ncbi:MAG: M16 family metallopeptidase [Bacteriovoracia bacterium]
MRTSPWNWRFLTLVLFAFLATIPLATPGKLGVQLKLEKHTLSNGLTVYFVENHAVPIISYQTWFRVGSADEKLGSTGIAHLFEHLMFKGTEKYPAKSFFTHLEAKGAEVNAFTTRDYTAYYANITPGLLEKTIDLESDRMANLKLDEAALLSERQVVLEERRLRTDNSPSGRMQEALWQMAFQAHPYQWPIIGYPEDLFRLTVKDLQDFFKRHYAPKNAAIVVVGDIQSEPTLALIRKYYEKIPAGEVPARDIPKEPEQSSERRLQMTDHVASEQFSWGYHVSSAQDDDSYALDVLANILFQGTSSRAHRLIVEQKNVALSVNGMAFTPTFPGLFIMSAMMKGDRPAAEAEALLAEVIREVQKKGVTEEEVQVAVKQLTVMLIDSVRTPQGLANLLGTVHAILGDARRYNEDLEKYLKIKPADVKRVANEYLHPNNRTVVVLKKAKATGDAK